MSVCGILLLLLTAAVRGDLHDHVVTVGDGQDVTLPCENVLKSQLTCSGTTWMVSLKDVGTSKELTDGLQIRDSQPRFSQRLTVMLPSCSLVIKNVTEKHVGRYSCRQYTDGKQQGNDSYVFLSVISIETQEYNDTILHCAVISYRGCEHTVNWLHTGPDDQVETTPNACSASVAFPGPGLHGRQSNRYESFTCNVTEKKTGNTQLCSAASRPLCAPTGTRTNPPGDTAPPTQPEWWLFVTVAVASALLIIIVVIVVWKKSKGNKPQKKENTEQRVSPAPETSQDTLDPEDGVPYASVSYVKNNNTQVREKSGDDGDEGETVTYSSVKVSPPAAAAEHSSIYATVNKSKKTDAAV
ncbi:uncharacterized protein V6R79_016553 [Siganus canaliculatus]